MTNCLFTHGIEALTAELTVRYRHPVDVRGSIATRTVEALRELGVQRLGPAHCMGAKATARLWHEFPQACGTCNVGSRFVFQR